MKKKICLAVLALTGLAGIVPVNAQGISINLNPNDRPYYTHGQSYFDGPRHYVWIGGHYSQRKHHWVPGHYALRRG